MNLKAIIDAVAFQADDLIADPGDRAMARTAISEFIATEHADLSAADRKAVGDGVMKILTEEDFFQTGGGPDKFLADSGEAPV